MANRTDKYNGSAFNSLGTARLATSAKLEAIAKSIHYVVVLTPRHAAVATTNYLRFAGTNTTAPRYRVYEFIRCLAADSPHQSFNECLPMLFVRPAGKGWECKR